MKALPIHQLIFKATHNSYDRGRPPEEQLDHFGVWAIELDFSVPEENRPPRAVVGHDGPGKALDDDPLSGGDPQATTPEDRFRLEYYLTKVRDTLAIRGKYRPVFIYFEKKPSSKWGLPAFDDHTAFLRLLEDELRSVFQDDIFGPAALAAYVDRYGDYPTVPELAGKVIPVIISWQDPDYVLINGTDLIFHGGPCPPNTPCISPINLTDRNNDDCDRPSDLESANIYRLNNYQADWTFEHGVPPNPLVVQSDAPLTTHINGCDDDEVDIHEQGTFLFPYRTIGQAVSRVEGSITPGGPLEQQRTGYGWTILIRPGNFPEILSINVPLKLKKDDRFAGNVVIGR